MLKKYFSLILIGLVMNLSLASTAMAETKAEKEARFAQKVKTEVTKLGTGRDAKVRIKLKDGTKLKGFISQIGENSFAVTDEKTGATTEVPYPNAKQVKGQNLSKGVTIAVVVGVVAAILVIALIAGANSR